MPRGKPNPYWGIQDLSSVEAAHIIGFANLELFPHRWAEATKEPPDLPSVGDDEEFAKTCLGWLVWDHDRRMLPKSARGLAEAKRIQCEVREALAAITRGDPAPLTRALNRFAPFHCRVSREPVSRRPGAKRVSRLRWRVAWAPEHTRGPQSAVVDHLLTALRFADRLGRCQHCTKFFLSERQWKRVPKFCSQQCTTAFHNRKRLASGYFTKWRRERRAREKREDARRTP